MLHKIVYGERIFTDNSIESGNIYRTGSLLSSSLSSNTFTVVVRSEDTGLIDFVRNSILRYYYKDSLVCLVYIQTIDRIGPDRYKIFGTSAVGLLIEQQHMGGIYTGQTASEVISSICDSIPFTIKSNLSDVKLYGWLPIASSRDNLSQVLFAIGAALKTDYDGILHIEGLWDGISRQIPKNYMYLDSTVKYDSKVTQVIVTEHQYIPWTEEKQLFEGTAQQGDIITFDGPMHSLAADGFTILGSGANWAKVSAGSGVLTGKSYLHNTRQLTKDVFQARDPNVKTVKDATLVSLVNSKACVQRLADYYKCQERVNASVVYHGELPGDRMAIYHPFDKIGVDACLESSDITLSGTLKAQEKSLVGFVPNQILDYNYINHVQIISSSGTFYFPEGAINKRAVLIGGGSGGTGGKNGRNGTNGQGCSGRGPGDFGANWYNGGAGSPGAGGEGGPGGNGGNVYQTPFLPDEVYSITVSIGEGGAGGASSETVGSNGNNTVITSGDLTYSSGMGSPIPSGFLELITGKIYAKTGNTGLAGAAGGEGAEDTNTSTMNTNLIGKSGEDAGTNKGGPGGSSVKINGPVSSSWYAWTRGCGGGGASYNANGLSGTTTSSSTKGGTGATGTTPTDAENYGDGGNGGNGGGGGGAGGGSMILVNSGYSASASGGSGGEGGAGGPGGKGAPGCVIVYYGIQEKVQSGQLVDKNNRMVLDRLGRRIIV